MEKSDVRYIGELTLLLGLTDCRSLPGVLAGEGEGGEEELWDEEGPGRAVEDAADGQEVGGLVEATNVLADIRHQPLAVGPGLESNHI